jgi:hypothetical protein
MAAELYGHAWPDRRAQAIFSELNTRVVEGPLEGGGAMPIGNGPVLMGSANGPPGGDQPTGRRR